MWGVGPVTTERLHAHGLRTVGQVAALEEDDLVSILGRGGGRHLHALAHNRDPRRVVVGRRRRSMGSQSALGRRHRSAEELDTILVGICDRIGRRLRKAHRVCRTITLRMRFFDWTRATRSHTLLHQTADTRTILATARGLLAGALPLIESKGISLLGLTLGNLESDRGYQLALPFERDRSAALDAAVDDVREKYGSEAITRAVLVGRERGWSPPLLPD